MQGSSIIFFLGKPLGVKCKIALNIVSLFIVFNTNSPDRFLPDCQLPLPVIVLNFGSRSSAIFLRRFSPFTILQKSTSLY